MKNTIIIGVMAATVLIAGCGKKEASSSNPTDPNATKQKENQQLIVVRFGPSNTLFVAGAPCPQTELAARLTQIVGQQNTNVVVRVIGANNKDDSRVEAVADACTKAGVHTVHYAQVNF
jgi:biopolymer transport protein ExbD